MKQKQPRLAELEISQVQKNGHGSSLWERNDGKIVEVEVPFSIPGDHLLVEVSKKRKTYQGLPLEWKKQSPRRITPLCRHFGSCGGCQWQQISYDEQLELKENWVYACLKSSFNSHTIKYPIIGCTPPWHYRNKMELTFSNDKQGNRYLGLFLFDSRGKVSNLQECHLCHSWMSQAAQIVGRWWAQSDLSAYHGRNDTGSLRTLTLREGMRTGDRLVMLTVSGNPLYSLQQKHVQPLIAALREGIEPNQPEQKLSIFLRIQQIAKGKPTQFYEMLVYGPDHLREILHLCPQPDQKFSMQFCVSPSAFFQPNTAQAERLYSRAIQLTHIPEKAVVYDLYCGTGTLGICMARSVKQVLGIELSPESVCDARENVKRNALTNVSIRQGDVGGILSNLTQEGTPLPHVVMVDPPRAGLDTNALSQILSLNVPQLTYISCNPETQGVNLEALIKGGYRLEAIQPIDQFPQTVHVENIAVLTR